MARRFFGVVSYCEAMIIKKYAHSPDEVIHVMREFASEEIYPYYECNDCPPPSLDEHKEYIESNFKHKNVFYLWGTKGDDLKYYDPMFDVRVGGDRKLLNVICV